MTRSISAVAALTLCLMVVWPSLARAQDEMVALPQRLDNPERYMRDAPADKQLHLVFLFTRKATRTERDALASWLTSQGFSVAPGNPDDADISCSGTVATAKTAFDIRIGMTENSDEWGALDYPKIPARFGDLVRYILGLWPSSDRPIFHRFTPSPSGGPAAR